MALSGDGTPAGNGPPGSRAALWALVLGVVTGASIIGLLAGEVGAPPSVMDILFTAAVICGLGSMVLGVVSLLPRNHLSNRGRRQAFAGAALGSLVLVGIGLSAASILVLTSQSKSALTQAAAQLQKTFQAQQRCISSAQRSGASPQTAFEACSGSSIACSSPEPLNSGASVCAGATFTNTSDPWGAILALLVWAGLVSAAGWLVFGPRGPPPLAGAAP